MHRQILAGAGAGTCQIVVTTPMELLKIQRQMAKAKGEKMIRNSMNFILNFILEGSQVLNSRQLALQLYREKGIAGLYKGVGATFTRDVVFSMMYFPMFAYFNDKVCFRDIIYIRLFRVFFLGKNSGKQSSPILSFICIRNYRWCYQRFPCNTIRW
jgi:solute carrier family 25 glutamate transporter 18/22